MKTRKTFEIEFEEPSPNWLCAQNLKIALEAYCTNTTFSIYEIHKEHWRPNTDQGMVLNAEYLKDEKGKATNVDWLLGIAAHDAIKFIREKKNSHLHFGPIRVRIDAPENERNRYYMKSIDLCEVESASDYYAKPTPESDIPDMDEAHPAKKRRRMLGEIILGVIAPNAMKKHREAIAERTEPIIRHPPEYTDLDGYDRDRDDRMLAKLEGLE